MPKFIIKTFTELEQRVLKHCNLTKDKFYFALRFDTCARCCEILSSKFGDITESKDCDGVLILKIKNAKKSGDEPERETYLTNSLQYFYQYKNEFMLKFGIKSEDELKDQYIFRNEDTNEPLSQQTYFKLCKRISKIEGFDFNPKFMRKFGLSALLKSGMPYNEVKKYAGHSQNADSLKHYACSDKQDVMNSILKINNIEVKEKEREKTFTKFCLRCKKPNSSMNESCCFCGFPLGTSKKVFEYEGKAKIDKVILKNSELKKSLIEELKKQIKAELLEEIENGKN